MNFNLDIRKGETFEVEIDIRKSYTHVNRIKMQSRIRPEDDSVLFEVFPELNGSILTIRVPETETANFDWKSAVYDVRIELNTGEVYYPIYGMIKVIPTVTR